MSRSIVVSATVVTDDQEHAARTAEVLARAVTGLVLEGVSGSLSLQVLEEDDEEDGT